MAWRWDMTASGGWRPCKRGGTGGLRLVVKQCGGMMATCYTLEDEYRHRDIGMTISLAGENPHGTGSPPPPLDNGDGSSYMGTQ